MSADIIQFIPRPNPDRAQSAYGEQITMDSTKGWVFDPTTNTWKASEPIPFEAPEKDPA